MCPTQAFCPCGLLPLTPILCHSALLSTVLEPTGHSLSRLSSSPSHPPWSQVCYYCHATQPPLSSPSCSAEIAYLNPRHLAMSCPSIPPAVCPIPPPLRDTRSCLRHTHAQTGHHHLRCTPLANQLLLTPVPTPVLLQSSSIPICALLLFPFLLDQPHLVYNILVCCLS